MLHRFSLRLVVELAEKEMLGSFVPRAASGPGLHLRLCTYPESFGCGFDHFLSAGWSHPRVSQSNLPLRQDPSCGIKVKSHQPSLKSVGPVQDFRCLVLVLVAVLPGSCFWQLRLLWLFCPVSFFCADLHFRKKFKFYIILYNNKMLL